MDSPMEMQAYVAMAADFVSDWILALSCGFLSCVSLTYLWLRQPSGPLLEVLHGMSYDVVSLIVSLVLHALFLVMEAAGLLFVLLVTVYHVARLAVKSPFAGLAATKQDYKSLYSSLKETLKAVVPESAAKAE